jgi:hypothetical protein
MKNLFLLIAFISILFSSCSTKFKVGAPYKEVTVVYGLLSTIDTAHYIKISKGYFDETLNNLELAKSPDSLTFNNLSVDMQVLNGTSVIETIGLTKVDLTLEGYPKGPGIFATSPNYAYKFKKALNPKYEYKLKIRNQSTSKEIEGQTPIISNLPANFQFVNPLNNFNYNLDFSDPNIPYQFSWNGPSAAGFYDIVLKFKYQEVDVNTADTIYVEKDVPLIKNVLASTGKTTAILQSITFFQQLNSTLNSPPFNIKRYVDTPDLVILAGGKTLKTYIDVNSAQGGITYDQIKPNYTNLVGENVYGILSTRGQIMLERIKLTSNTIDSIINGRFTRNLRFVGISNK